jgi:hypothetical protein
MNSGEIAKRNAYREGDTIAIYGNAYRITDAQLYEEEVRAIQVVENGRDVDSKTTCSLNLTLDGWRLVSL